ncbi:MAG: GNAT family N-acetyltransferase [Oscillospiraceae bacterium]|nr:GNAT family N-acetyltransferase [Oscillospiraceae bacterium]
MVTLRNFRYDDASVLQRFLYANMPIEEIQSMILDWSKYEYHGKYFEIFAIIHDGSIVGTVSLSEHSDNVVSIGEEVFSAYQRQGFGKKAMNIALEIAKDKGYKIVLQQVRSNNIPSIAMHQSLGFETDRYEYINKRGNEVLLFLKALS